MPAPGFQALILCGPGVSYNTFTANPEEFPKALIPIANRPMIWYPLDWCHRMGITNIHLITPPSSSRAIEAALSQNPHLTSLPLPTADILAPETLSQTSGTTEILRHPDVQAVVTGDFLVLPCDLICEIPGELLLEAWMVQESGLGGAASLSMDYQGPIMGLGGERGGRRGGLGVWYQAKTNVGAKGAETDFIMTTALPSPTIPPPSTSIRPHLSRLLYATTADTLRDITSEKEHFPIRHGLLRKYGRIRMLTTHRDAHIYIFPHWVLEFISRNERFDSISEDVVGWWAKSSWQDGLAIKLGLRSIFDGKLPRNQRKDGEIGDQASRLIEDDIDIAGLSTTHPSALPPPTWVCGWCKKARLSLIDDYCGECGRRKDCFSTAPGMRKEVTHLREKSSAEKIPFATKNSSRSPTSPESSPSQPSSIPPIMAYIHPSPLPATAGPPPPLLLRVDTPALLLRTSLHLATLSPSTHPFSHPHKTATPSLLAPQTNIHTGTTLLDSNVTVASRAVIKESVLGSSCAVGSGARISQSVLMEEVDIGERVVLSGCVIGRRARVGKGSVLMDCEVQGGFIVEEGTEAKGEKFMAFDGMDEDEGEDDGELGEEQAGQGLGESMDL